MEEMVRPDDIVTVLRSRILGLEYGSGTPLREEALAQEFGASRRTARDALITLAAWGLVDREPHRGAHVRTFRPGDVADLYQARRAWETFGASHAATAPPESTHAVTSAYTALVEITRDRPDSTAHAEADMAFHARVAALAQSPRLDRAFSTLGEEMTLAIRILQRDETRSPGDVEADIAEHRAIVDAVAAGDPRAAVTAVEKHIRTNRARLVSLATQLSTPAS
jgi:DNA-binding GntR family transcriptional regulator